MRNNTYIRYETMCKKKKGYIETKELLEEGFSNRQISVLEKEGYLEKICHGYYWLNGREYKKPDDYKCIEVCLSAPRAIICMGSALYYQKAIDREPESLSVATERTDRSLIKMKFPVERHYFSAGVLQIGVQRRETEFGCYNIYNVERSVCDMVRLKSDPDIEIINKVSESENCYKRLLTYAEQLKVKGLQ